MRYILASIIAIALATPVYAQAPAAAPAADAAAKATTDVDEAQVISDAETQVKAALQNASKAQFDHMVVRVDADGKQVVCGKVTRPNKDGFMNNIRYFVLKDGLPRLLNRDDWQTPWKTDCGALPGDVHELTPEELQLQKLRKMKIAPAHSVEE